MTGDLLSSRYRSPLLITIDHPSTHKKLLLPSQLNLSSFSSGRRASFELNCLLISLSTDSLFSQIFKIAIALTPPTAKKNTARKCWLERNAISPNSSSYRLIAPRALSVAFTRYKLKKVSLLTFWPISPAANTGNTRFTCLTSNTINNYYNPFCSWPI